jgi:hypothetical protein
LSVTRKSFTYDETISTSCALDTFTGKMSSNNSSNFTVRSNTAEHFAFRLVVLT